MHIVVVIIITTTKFVINTNINTHITQQTDRHLLLEFGSSFADHTSNIRFHCITLKFDYRNEVFIAKIWDMLFIC